MDSTASLNGSSVVYNTVVANDSANASMEIEDGYRDYVVLAGKMSNIIQVSTTSATIPGTPPKPVFVNATGGTLRMMLASPDDTGGIPITG